MKLTITIKMDNAAFEPECPGYEAARILRDLADRIEQGSEYENLRDYNGNSVGFAEITK